MTLRAGSARERYTRVTDIERASRECRVAEKTGVLKASAT